MNTDQEQLLQNVADAIKAAHEGGVTAIGYFGMLPATSGTVRWWSIHADTAVGSLFTNPDYKVAQILSVLGSEVRLGILRTLFGGPKTAAELVSEMQFGTKGQAYHHLRELERAGYVEQRGSQWHFKLNVGRVYLASLALAADAGARPDDDSEPGIVPKQLQTL